MHLDNIINFKSEQRGRLSHINTKFKEARRIKYTCHFTDRYFMVVLVHHCHRVMPFII